MNRPDPENWMEASCIGGDVVQATYVQRWYTIACTSECRNAGPYRVWAPEGDNFFCAACGELMRRSAM